ncbi:MAG: hypothetical protein M3186_09890 [Actinomycetota bacterium]|nr:hypothetical protein [Actinomycetota bacterium]
MHDLRRLAERGSTGCCGGCPYSTPIARSRPEAGRLLGRNGLDSCHTVHAFVAATALDASPAVVLTGDRDDLGRLVGGDLGVQVQPLP